MHTSSSDMARMLQPRLRAQSACSYMLTAQRALGEGRLQLTAGQHEGPEDVSGAFWRIRGLKLVKVLLLQLEHDLWVTDTDALAHK